MVYNLTENIIKGIIVSHFETGISTKEIKDEYLQHVGEPWPMAKQCDYELNKFLEQIPGVYSEKTNNGLKWFVKRPCIKPAAINGTEVENTVKYGEFHYLKPPVTVDGNNRNKTNACSPPKVRIPKEDRRQGSDRGGRNTGSRFNTNRSRDNNNNRAHYRNANHVNGQQITRVRSHASVYHENQMKRNSAMLYDYEIVGDDFFMAIATIDLKNQYIKNNRIRQCGLCISGQMIRDAVYRLKNLPNAENRKFILNVGSVDLLHGAELVDMYRDYKELVSVCEARNIPIIITTLPPLGNKSYIPDIVKNVRKFNEFLIKNFSQRHQVIDIQPCMYDKQEGIIYSCYQAEAKYVSGSREPHLLWNRVGRQRILKHIQQNLVL